MNRIIIIMHNLLVRAVSTIELVVVSMNEILTVNSIVYSIDIKALVVPFTISYTLTV